MNISTNNSIQHIALLRRQQEKSHKNHHQKLSLILMGILAFPPMVSAGLPDTDIFNDMQEVTDGDLKNMRGKFASNNQVLYFGVQMVSQWQTASGQLIEATANLNIDFNQNGNIPVVQYVPTITIVQGTTPVANAGTSNVSGGAGLSNVSGISQSIQVAGISNDIQNGIDMQVNMVSTGLAGGSVANAIGSAAGSISAAGDDGTVATVTLANNSIGVNVVVPGQGQVMQEIRNQGMFQAARIGGDFNHIHNAITMQIGLNNIAGAAFNSGYVALQGIKGLPVNGVF